MSAIKKFFQKRKLDIKFKKAGGGHALNEEPKASRPSGSRGYQAGQATSPRGPGEEARRAAEAALARQTSREKDRQADPTMAAKARMRRELEAERKKQSEAEALAQRYRDPIEEVVQDGAPMAAILFKCPDIGEMVLPKDEMEAYIHEFLLNQLAEEPEMSSALMIHTLNKDKEQVKVCVDTLCKYIDNIAVNPTEEKFRKVRLSNKAFKERVAALKGTEEFMQATGFQMKMLPFEDHEENFYVMEEETAKDVERLKSIKEVLLAAKIGRAHV